MQHRGQSARVCNGVPADVFFGPPKIPGFPPPPHSFVMTGAGPEARFCLAGFLALPRFAPAASVGGGVGDRWNGGGSWAGLPRVSAFA